jgi:hypothetical protein
MNLVLNVSEQTVNAVTGRVGDGRGTIDLHVVNGPIIIEGLDPF